MANGDREYLIWVVMLFTVIAISSFVFGYADNLNLFFSDNGETVAPDKSDIEDTEGFLTKEEQEELSFLERAIRNIRYNLGRIWGFIRGVANEVPMLGAIWTGAEWVWSGFVFVISILAWQGFPEEMPLIIKVLILSPVYAGMLMVIIEVGFKFIQGAPQT